MIRKSVTILLNKPHQMLSQFSLSKLHPHKTLSDLEKKFPVFQPNIYPIGRLDKDSGKHS